MVPHDLFSKYILTSSWTLSGCHMKLLAGMKKSRDTILTIGHMVEELDEWSPRAFMVDIKLMYYRCVNFFGSNGSSRSANLHSSFVRLSGSNLSRAFNIQPSGLDLLTVIPLKPVKGFNFLLKPLEPNILSSCYLQF